MNADFYVPLGNGQFLPMLITSVRAADYGGPDGLQALELTMNAVSCGSPVTRPEDGIPVRELSA